MPLRLITTACVARILRESCAMSASRILLAINATLA